MLQLGHRHQLVSDLVAQGREVARYPAEKKRKPENEKYVTKSRRRINVKRKNGQLKYGYRQEETKSKTKDSEKENTNSKEPETKNGSHPKKRNGKKKKGTHLHERRTRKTCIASESKTARTPQYENRVKRRTKTNKMTSNANPAVDSRTILQTTRLRGLPGGPSRK